MKPSSTNKRGASPVALEAAVRLRTVEALLDHAMDDLVATGGQAPGVQCAATLGDAAAELQAIGGLLTQHDLDRATLRRQLNALLPRLQIVERLLAAAAEFYRGWCAAAPVPDYAVGGYQADTWTNLRGPALIAFEA